MSSTTSDPSTAPLALAAISDIRSCVEFRQQVIDSQDSAGSVVIDAGALQSGDVTCIQILVAAAKSAQRLGGAVEVINAGPAFMGMLSRCGIDALAAGLQISQEREPS